ncbi:MAG: 50S ribosomal protein L23 [Spirochaetes bacterium]|nr:50S ribosomal protein L23 [Spirochaetota bacterium]
MSYNYNDILVRPVLSEKSTEMSQVNKYVFRVPMYANKHIISKAVKDIFNVTPVKINIMKVRGRRKRVRYHYGYTTSWKKAIVTLNQNEKIELFENQ